MAEEKATPQPIDDSLRLEAGLERALTDARPELRVSLKVAGGAPTQRYRFAFSASGDRRARCSLDCELTGRHEVARKDATLEPKQLDGLIRKIRTSKVLELPEESARFLPDTLLGILEISDGTSTFRRVFAADPEQAKTQDAVPPPELLEVADSFYSLGRTLMGKKSMRAVKP